MQKIVINTCYGGFDLSKEALDYLVKVKNPFVLKKQEYYKIISEDYINDIPRDDKDLVKCVQKLKSKANGWPSNLKIVEIPDDVKWEIQEYDGKEWIAEKHRTWR